MTHKNGKKVGYVRVSSFNQSPDLQLEGIELDRKFIDTASGKSITRPELDAMMDYVREGDILIVHSMDRLARNLDDLKRIVCSLTQKQIRVQFLKENLTFSGEDSPMSHLLLSMMEAFVEFERSLIKERQLEGIILAKKKGIYKGRKSILSGENRIEIDLLLQEGVKKIEVARRLKISRETLYRYLRFKGLKNNVEKLG